MGNFHFSIYGSHLVDCLDIWRESSVDAENFIFDKGSQRKVVKSLVEILPWSWTSVLFHDFIVESIHSGNLPGLMISPEQNDVFGVFKLITEEEFDGLDGIVPSINKIADEDIPWSWKLSSNLKEFKYVIKLAMNVSANDDRGFSFMHVWLLKQKLFDLIAKSAYAALVKTFALFEGGNPFVHFGHCI